MRNKSTSARYAVAIVAVGIAFALRYGLYGTLENRIPFAFFTLSTLISAWYGGLGPGMLAAMSGLVLADYFFLPPHSPDGGIGEAARTSIGIYALTNTLIIVLFWHLHNKLRETEDQLHRLKGEAPVAGVTGEHPVTPSQMRPL